MSFRAPIIYHTHVWHSIENDETYQENKGKTNNRNRPTNDLDIIVTRLGLKNYN